MNFARSVWKILVAIKDGLVLALLLLFFWALYAVLTMRPVPGMVRDGALYVTLDGPVVEEKARLDPTALLLSQQAPRHEVQTRDLARAIETAAEDARIKAVVLDLDGFGGGSQVAMERIGAAMDKARAAKKPVLVRAMLYTDDAALLAAHASEAWVDPVGGLILTGPGGTQLYYKTLLDKLQVTAHVFKVGTYKSAVEPFIRSDASPEARENLQGLLGALWAEWQANVKRARPRADIAAITSDPVRWLAASGGDAAQAAVKSGLVDRIGDKVAFGRRVAQLVGADPAGPDGAFRSTSLAAYLADRPAPGAGKAIAVVTVAGDIVDGKAGPGVAGGDRIADLIDGAVSSGDYSALVVRVDSPGGSVPAAERIRAAIDRARARKLPVVVSMGSLAASGGYWVSTPAERIFAEPSTITGSIGVFAVIPTFEGALGKLGVTTDGVRTTPLSGQPDVLGGLNPQFAAVTQNEVDNIYARFIGLVGKARGKTPEQVDAIAQGRVWDGGTARQIGLVDQFGGIEDALAYAAKRAGAQQWHAVWLGAGNDTFGSLLEQIMGSSVDQGEGQGSAHDIAGLVAGRQQALASRLLADLDRLGSGAGAQVYCAECAGLAAPARTTPAAGRSLLQTLVLRLLG
ncbi:signal peptide peptidase SppA [Novosphingobium huizhouense]|uniref:signal peptide peptidase SppA n=1 Tax=Novosphingobium huizhouense TaxID=2866625 RepID=UPI001CD83947|nr:signal peptide peptidase SppA [Novosphingobium huizhouense]